MPSLKVASKCRSSARHAFQAFLFCRSFAYAWLVCSRSRRRRSFSIARPSISWSELLVCSAICARLRCAAGLMRTVAAIQMCIRHRMRNCQRTRNPYPVELWWHGCRVRSRSRHGCLYSHLVSSSRCVPVSSAEGATFIASLGHRPRKHGIEGMSAGSAIHLWNELFGIKKASTVLKRAFSAWFMDDAIGSWGDAPGSDMRRRLWALNRSKAKLFSHFLKLPTDYRSFEAIDGDACLAVVSTEPRAKADQLRKGAWLPRSFTLPRDVDEVFTSSTPCPP